MKYQYLTINTGHLSHHDTDVNLNPAIADAVAGLLARQVGSVPAMCMPLSYRFTDSGGSGAVLSVLAGVNLYVWTAGFYLRDDEAMHTGMVELCRDAIMIGNAISPSHLVPPGLALVIQRAAAVVPGEDMFTLADFAKTMFSVWALDRERALAAPP